MTIKELEQYTKETFDKAGIPEAAPTGTPAPTSSTAKSVTIQFGSGLPYHKSRPNPQQDNGKPDQSELTEQESELENVNTHKLAKQLTSVRLSGLSIKKITELATRLSKKEGKPISQAIIVERAIDAYYAETKFVLDDLWRAD